ncbi:MAG TPA: helix-turn-helix transcriptional regulator [Pseudonocardiaceae bacterium]|jgi:transcriptional regulator with XRE-family HTH domain|nr:helix-turn-helix transcriptional regulator [Pseudonocardiaceae bacterium]
MTFGVSTVRSRELGGAVRAAMDVAGLSGKQLARLLDWSESKVSRVVTGNAVISEIDLSAMLALCHVTGRDRGYLLDLNREQTILGWQTDHRILADNQCQAMRITEFQGSLIPILLQVEGYARSIIARTTTVSFDKLDEQVAARMASQQIFNRSDPPNCIFFVHEVSLQLPIDSEEIMAEQLHHLLRMSIRSSITIRVVPTALGAKGSLIGSCCLMEFSDVNPVAYIDNDVAGFFVEQPALITAYQQTFAALSAAALDEGSSRDLLRDVAANHYGGPAVLTNMCG